MTIELQPDSIGALLERARRIDGMTVGALAESIGSPVADDPTRTKGRIGELVEHALGASAGSLDIPDFPHLGVELKTIPLDRAGRPQESTYVCAIDLAGAEREEWETSRLWRKLRCVLWIPVEAVGMAPLNERHFGRPLLWRPRPDEQALLRADWALLIGRIAVGAVEEVTAHLGEVLQVRPKAANASVRVAAFGPDREDVQTVPRGFYLRAKFTQRVLWRLTE